MYSIQKSCIAALCVAFAAALTYPVSAEAGGKRGWGKSHGHSFHKGGHRYGGYKRHGRFKARSSVTIKGGSSFYIGGFSSSIDLAVRPNGGYTPPQRVIVVRERRPAPRREVYKQECVGKSIKDGDCGEYDSYQ